MRLNCPNCGAQYEVPIDVIPAEGRDVQCSTCGNTWFQPHPDHAAEPDLDLDIPAAENQWVPEPEVSETAEPSGESLQETLKEAVRAQMPEEVEEVIAEEVESRLDESPLGDFEAELDAQLASSDDVTWDAPEEEPAPAEIAPAVEPEPAPAEETFADPEPEMPEPNESVADESDALFAAPTADEAPRGRARRRREVDPAVADILREEANHEAEARRAEEGAIETQQEFGLDTPEEDETTRRAGQARARMARMRGLPEDTPAPAVAAPDTGGSRRNLLPDIEEINSTLRATEDRTPEELPDGRPTPSQRRRGGSRLGFGFALILIAGLMFVYARPGTVTEQFPQAAPVVSGYVNTVDDGRIWLDVQMTKLMLWLDGMASEDTTTDA